MTRTGRSRLVASPRMARRRDGLMSRCHGRQGATAHATAQDVPSVECAKDGIAFRPESTRVMRFSLSDKRIAMERMRTG